MSSYAAKQVQRKLRAIADLPAGEPVPSPCICVCRVDPRSGLCDGCFRTLDEIAGWTAMSDAGKREVWMRLGERAGATATQEPGDPQP
ncbi:DUF1289 domain-containing protein [Ramlibacter sp.]|uniref:DUF1289 domain-containing protein n=1 Tax=Ramlibacter sp. TaxID=1917967 RepID=UPI002D6E9A9B|nr:DUF1289 domain-containing protein [Ramlibacter sp.]HYD77821.1 DUF1289 domain-containing protein [Ramlibacter sp.]